MRDHPTPSDADFRLLFERAPEPYLVLLPDRAFTIVDVNTAYLRVTNTSRESLMGRGLFEAFPDNPEDPQASGVANLRASLERVVESQLPDTMAFQRYDIPRPAEQGGGFEERYWSPVNTPVVSSDGELRYIIHRVEDVTDFVRLAEAGDRARDRVQTLQVKNEEMAAELLNRSRELRASNAQLRESEERYRLIGRATNDIIWDWDLETDQLEWNEAVISQLDLTPEELGPTIQGWYDRIHPEDRERVVDGIHAAINSGANTWSDEYRFRRRDGSYADFLDRGYIGHDTAGKPHRMIGSMLDLTERRRMEEALRESDRRKDEFLAMLAHELRNPLAAVQNVTTLLEKACAEPLTLRYVKILRHQAGTLTGLVDDLLDVSRITRGLTDLRREPVDLVTVADRALESVQALMDERRHEVSVTLPRKPVWVQGDATRLEQIMVNLLTNAAKYTDPGGQVALVLERKNGLAELWVRDDGIGMSAEVLERIFDLFGQAERGLARSEGGLGIGLTIVKRLVELHEGRVEARSPGAGMGAEFLVCLPLAAEPPAKAPVAPEPAAAGGSRRVLVVEDSPEIAETLALLLEDAGYEVALAQDGPSAVVRAERFQPEVILLDIGLPGMDGFEVARRLRADPRLRSATLAALTGYGQPGDRARAEAAGFDAHFVKPVDIEALEAFIAGAGGRELQD